MVYAFYKNHICVFLSVSNKEKTNTLHLHCMRGGIKTLKHNVRTTLQLAYHGCQNLTHTSKTPHAKRTQMVVTVRFTIRVTSLHRWNKQGIKICDWFLAYYTCGVKLVEYTYAQVWNIAKRRKQSPIGWFPLKQESADSSKAGIKSASKVLFLLTLNQGFPTFFAARTPLSGQSILSTPKKFWDIYCSIRDI